MNEEDYLNALKEKAKSIAPLYVDTWHEILQERICAADKSGATECPAKEFGRWDGLWDKQPEREISILDFIREATRGGSGSIYFYSYKGRSDRTGCLMAYNINGKSACLITEDDFYSLSYPVRQRLDAYLTELAVSILYEVALRLVEEGCTLSFAKNPETDPRIGMAEEDLDEEGYDGEYDMYIRISWEQRQGFAKQTPASVSPTCQPFWYRIVGD